MSFINEQYKMKYTKLFRIKCTYNTHYSYYGYCDRFTTTQLHQPCVTYKYNIGL